MENYIKTLLAALMGYTATATWVISLSLGDLFYAFVVGFIGAVGGILANLLYRVIKKWYKKKFL